MRLFGKFIAICLFGLCLVSSVSGKDTPKIYKVFAMSPPTTALLEILYPQGMIGLNYKPYPEDKIFMPEGVADLPVLGLSKGDRQVLFERLISLKPDVLIFDVSTPKEVLESYAKFGIKIVQVESHNIDKIIETIKAYDKALEIGKKAKDLIKFIQDSNAKLESLRLKITHRPKIYFAQGMNGLSTQCYDKKAEGENDLAHKIGGVNVITCSMLANSGNISQVNFEILFKANPDIIFVREIGLYKEMINNPSKQWQRLKAVQNKQVFYAPSTPSNWLMKPPSVMQTLGIPWAFAKVQPKLLSDDEVRASVLKFFKTFIREISDDDYAYIEGKIER